MSWDPKTRDEAVRPPWLWDKPEVRPAATPSDDDGRDVITRTIAATDVAAERAAIVGKLLGPDVKLDVDRLTDRTRLGLRSAPRLAAVTER